MTREPDSFDIGYKEQIPQERAIQASQGGTLINQLVSNPKALSAMFGLNPTQAQNVADILTGAGAGIGAYALQKMLGKAVGRRMAATIGAALGAYFSATLADKIQGQQ